MSNRRNQCVKGVTKPKMQMSEFSSLGHEVARRSIYIFIYHVGMCFPELVGEHVVYAIRQTRRRLDGSGTYKVYVIDP